MSVISDRQLLERLKFFDGQRLFAADLDAVTAFQREMRQLHNRSLHQAGVGSGFAVVGQKGDREVGIGPGYAIDNLGREIVHAHAIREAIPPVAGEADGSPAAFFLTVSYPGDDELDPVETRAGVCVEQGAVRLREEPNFCWIRLRRTAGAEIPGDKVIADQIANGARVVLARIEVLDCRLYSLSVAQRRNARPNAQPYIACGQVDDPFVDAKSELWFHGPVVSRALFVQLLACETDVPTAAANFRTTPTYTARIEGPRDIPVPNHGQEFRVLADALVSVKDNQNAPSAGGFTAHMLILVASDKRFPELSLDAFSDWKLVWMGVE